MKPRYVVRPSDWMGAGLQMHFVLDTHTKSKITTGGVSGGLHATKASAEQVALRLNAAEDARGRESLARAKRVDKFPELHRCEGLWAGLQEDDGGDGGECFQEGTRRERRLVVAWIEIQL